MWSLSVTKGMGRVVKVYVELWRFLLIFENVAFQLRADTASSTQQNSYSISHLGLLGTATTTATK